MHSIHPYTCGTMRTPWRQELVQSVNEHIRASVAQRWPGVNETYTMPRAEMEHIRSSINWLHPAPAPDRSDWNGTGHHGDPRFYVPRDLLLIDRCDLLVTYIGKEGHNLGGATEVGYAYAHGKRIVTIDNNQEHQSYDAWRVLSTAIFTTVDECARFLMFLVHDDLHVPEPIDGTLVAQRLGA